MGGLFAVAVIVVVACICLLLIFAAFAWGGAERIAKGLGLMFLVFSLTSCGGGDPSPAMVHATPNTTNIKSTNPDPVIIETPPAGTVGLSAWPRYYALPTQQCQEIGVLVTLDDYELPLADLIVCVDSDCQPALTDGSGYASLSFCPPAEGWSLDMFGQHAWSVRYIESSPPLLLAGSFVAVMSDNGGDE